MRASAPTANSTATAAPGAPPRRPETEPPLIDEWACEIAADAPGVWDALALVVPRAFSGIRSRALARGLACDQTTSSGSIDRVGATISGFRVTRARPPHELVLEGRHRFSRYRLTFRVRQPAATHSQLSAETRAAFPRLVGQIYRGLVIDTRLHSLVVRKLLRAVARRAEGSSAARLATPRRLHRLGG